MPTDSQLFAPDTINEGACLLRDDGLPRIVVETKIAEAETPGTGIAEIEIAETGIPGVEVAETKIEKTEVAGTEIPATEVAGTEIPGAEIPGAEVAETEILGTKIPGTKGLIAAFFSYSPEQEHLEDGGQEYQESYQAFPLKSIRLIRGRIDIGSYFPEEVLGKPVIHVAVFNGCVTGIVKKLLDEPSAAGSSLLDSGLKISGDFITGISLRAKFGSKKLLEPDAKPEPEESLEPDAKPKQKKSLKPGAKPKGEHTLELFSCFPYLGYRTHPALINASQQLASGNSSQQLAGNTGQRPATATSQQSATASTQSLDLRQYRSKILGGPLVGSADFSNISVHQAWFLLINGERVVVFKSNEDELSIRAPLFQYQQRLGTFHALVQMISNTLTTSETAALKHIYEEIPKKESAIKFKIKKASSSDSSNSSRSDRRGDIKDIAKSISDFEDSLDDISNMIRVVQTQIELLQDLRDIFQSSFGKIDKVGKPRPRRNAVKIPFIVDAPEEMRVAIETIDAVVQERETVRAGLRMLLNDFKCSRVFSFQANQMSNDKMESIETHIKKQGQTITLFTFITTVFLPLGFFGQYFAIVFPTSVTKRGFWNISGSVTFVMIVFMSFFLFISDEKMKEWITDPVKGLLGSKKGQKPESTNTPGPETTSPV